MPRLEKVMTLFYVLTKSQKEAAPILTQPRKYGISDRLVFVRGLFGVVFEEFFLHVAGYEFV